MRKLFFLLINLIIAGSIFADDKVTFTASAPDVVGVGDQFRLSYMVTTTDVKDFRAPSSITGFDILMGPSRSIAQSTQIINGKTTSTGSITYSYTLIANKEGTFSIPAASIVVDGEKLISNSVSIKVLPKESATNSSGSGTASPRGNSSRQSSSSSDDDIPANALFVTATPTKTEVYEQEALLLTYKIYVAVDLRGFDNVKLPDFKGFMSQEVELSNQQWSLEQYKGKNYKTTVYRQFVLFPQHSGELTIEPARFDASIAKAARNIDPFDAFFNGASAHVEVKKTLYTPKVKINVKSLPAGKPLGFSGGVGDFKISSSISNTEIKTNDAVTVKLVISGTGNLKLVSNPEVKFPADFEVYDPKVDNKVRLTRDGLTGSKVIEYLAIARHAGKFKIPSVAFSYFDIKSKTYKTHKTEEYEINVEKGKGNATQVVADFTNKEELKVLGEDVRFIKRNDVKLRPGGYFFFGSLTNWLFYIIPLLVFVVFVIVYRKQAVENANVAKMRTKKANKMATKRLKVAGKLLAENKKEEFYDEVLKALWGYISDKLNIPVSKLSKDNIEGKLIKHGVGEDLVKEFLNALNECEFARFAPGDEGQAMDNVYTVALNVISKIENSIKR